MKILFSLKFDDSKSRIAIRSIDLHISFSQGNELQFKRTITLHILNERMCKSSEQFNPRDRVKCLMYR